MSAVNIVLISNIANFALLDTIQMNISVTLAHSNAPFVGLLLSVTHVLLDGGLIRLTIRYLPVLAAQIHVLDVTL